jgi:hypothetical protein
MNTIESNEQKRKVDDLESTAHSALRMNRLPSIDAWAIQTQNRHHIQILRYLLPAYDTGEKSKHYVDNAGFGK